MEEASGLIEEAKRKIENRQEAEIPVPEAWLKKLKEVEEELKALREEKGEPEKANLPPLWKVYRMRVDQLSEALKKVKDQEWNYRTLQQVVAVLCLRYGLGVGLDEGEEKGAFLVLDLPTGQVSFRLSGKQRKGLARIGLSPWAWDGHSVEEKRNRIEAFLESAEKPGATGPEAS